MSSPKKGDLVTYIHKDNDPIYYLRDIELIKKKDKLTYFKAEASNNNESFIAYCMGKAYLNLKRQPLDDCLIRVLAEHFNVDTQELFIFDFEMIRVQPRGEEKATNTLGSRDLNVKEKFRTERRTERKELEDDLYPVSKKLKIPLNETRSTNISDLMVGIESNIMLRVSYKSDIFQFSPKAAPEPQKRFFIIANDEFQDIELHFWGDDVTMLYYDKIQVGKIFNFWGGSVVKAFDGSKKTERAVSISFNPRRRSSISEVATLRSIPMQIFALKEIKDLNKETDKFVDLIAFVAFYGEKEISGKNFKLITLSLHDISYKKFVVTLWVSLAYEFSVNEGEILCIKRLKIIENPVTKTLEGCSDFDLTQIYPLDQIGDQPNIPLIASYQNWKNASLDRSLVGKQIMPRPRTCETRFCKIKELSFEGSFESRERKQFKILGNIFQVSPFIDGFLYPSCPICLKKLRHPNPQRIPLTEFVWVCIGNNKHDEKAVIPNWRYYGMLTISDHTGTFKATFFHNIGRLLFGENVENASTEEILQIIEDKILFSSCIVVIQSSLDMSKEGKHEMNYIISDMILNPRLDDVSF